MAPTKLDNTCEWLGWLHDELPRPTEDRDAVTVLDLFAGAGGLALGFEAIGFNTVGYEMNAAAVQTYATNLAGDCHEVFLSPGMPDVEAEVIIGGPPCQPFSQIGYQRGQFDKRDGLPVFIDAMRRLQPKIAIMENVRGLLYRNKSYFRGAVQAMTDLGYEVDARILTAVDYGVPQKRERVFVVASKIGWSWPSPTVETPVTVGTALGRLAQAEEPASKHLTPSMDAYIAKYEARSNCVRPRDLHVDQPARTVTCRNLSGATSDMLRLALPSGNRRRLTVREGARLQSFPDWFEFAGRESEQFEQIGNAVPPLLSLALARQAKAILDDPHVNPRRVSMNAELFPDSVTEKVEQALVILRCAGIPVRDVTARRRERVAKALIAVAHLGPDSQWSDAKSYCDGTAEPLTSRQILRRWNRQLNEKIADSSYDDIRRKDLNYLVEGGLVEPSAANPDAATNDGTRGFALTQEGLRLLRSYGGATWEDQLQEFRSSGPTLSDRLAKAREFTLVPVTLPDGSEFKLSPGEHNRIQKAVIEEFLPRFSKGASVLYLGEASKRLVHIEQSALDSIGLSDLSAGALPDVVAYEKERDWLYLIEAVHSSNPIDDMRHLALRELTKEVTCERLFVSAFANSGSFARFSKHISWETAVWIADQPDHLVHFDGSHYLTPYRDGKPISS